MLFSNAKLRKTNRGLMQEEAGIRPQPFLPFPKASECNSFIRLLIFEPFRGLLVYKKAWFLTYFLPTEENTNEAPAASHTHIQPTLLWPPSLFKELLPSRIIIMRRRQKKKKTRRRRKKDVAASSITFSPANHF